MSKTRLLIAPSPVSGSFGWFPLFPLVPIFLVAIFLQWLICDGVFGCCAAIFRVVGSTLAAFLTFVFVFRWRRSISS